MRRIFKRKKKGLSSFIGPPQLKWDRYSSLLFLTGPQQTNSSLQTGPRSTRCLVVEKLQFLTEDDDCSPPSPTLIKVQYHEVVPILNIFFELKCRVSQKNALKIEDWDISHLKGGIHSSVKSTKNFCTISGSQRISKS